MEVKVQEENYELFFIPFHDITDQVCSHNGLGAKCGLLSVERKEKYIHNV